MPKFHSSKEFVSARAALSRRGERDAQTQLSALYREVALGGAVAAQSRVKEARVPNAEVFTLGDRFQVVTQHINAHNEKRRVFLFVGTIAECDAWLEQHRGYQYVVDEKDKKLDFIPLNASPKRTVRQVNPDLALELLQQPLLRHLTDADWDLLDIGQKSRSQLSQLLHRDFGEPEVEELLSRLLPVTSAVLFDVMIATNEGSPEKVRARLDAFHGERRVASDADILDALDRPINSDQYVTFDDPEELDQLLRRESWEDWMLFLHPKQREIVSGTFAGPVRVRGVSGSGKTSIVVHRARILARRHEQRVTVVTLTGSMTKLIAHLTDALCGVESSLIHCTTARALAHDVVKDLSPSLYKGFLPPPGERELRDMRVDELHRSGAFDAWKGTALPRAAAENYLDDELTDVRENYLVGERDRWLTVERRGRVRPLPRSVRERVLAAIESYESILVSQRTSDGPLMVLHAMEAALSGREKLLASSEATEKPFARCVLVDEGQDLSRNELRLLMSLTNHGAEDSFFIVGDYAQRIFKRHTTLKSAGLEVRGRAFVFKKNYRNTAQILRAARRLLEDFEIAELGEDDEAARIDVDLPAREGAAPEILRFDDVTSEVAWIVDEIGRIRQEDRAILGAGIGVVSPSPRHRDAIARGLEARSIPVVLLRDDVVASSAAVKVSTIESAKGHEFSAVFMPGISEGLIPHSGADEEEQQREAARMYVAMTRARERLVMTWDRGHGASSFLTTMMAFCRQGVHRSGVMRMDDDE
jgi:superfamily I DNA/RNA helicase